MKKEKFSKWFKWEQRNSIKNISFPGIYVIARSKENLSDKKLKLIKEIIYIGMTNSKGGLKQRLKQFNNTITTGKKGHGGADRIKYKFRDHKNLIPCLYVSVFQKSINTKNPSPEDYIKMGEIAALEYDAFAWYLKKFHKLPKFNDKKISPKHSSMTNSKKKTV